MTMRNVRAVEKIGYEILIRNVNGIGDRPAYGLAAAQGVIIVSIKEGPGLMKSGIQTKEVIVEADGGKIKDIYELMNPYQLVNRTGKISVMLMRNQQLKTIVILLK